MINFPKLMSSFRWAARGLAHTVRTQQNARIHVMAMLVVTGFGIGLKVAPMEWIALILAMGMVFSAEVMNTSLEVLCDRVSPDHDDAIGLAKDVAAGAVFVAAIVSALVGFIIFLPKIFAIFQTTPSS